jgi:hypothetical protein
MNLQSVLRAHDFMRVERPAELWHVDVEDGRLIPLLGEMVAFALSRGNVLGKLVLHAANVVIEKASSNDIPSGEFVAISIVGKGDWGPEWTWRPGAASPTSASSKLQRVIANSSAAFAYARHISDGGSITVFLPRALNLTQVQS